MLGKVSEFCIYLFIYLFIGLHSTPQKPWLFSTSRDEHEQDKGCMGGEEEEEERTRIRKLGDGQG